VVSPSARDQAEGLSNHNLPFEIPKGLSVAFPYPIASPHGSNRVLVNQLIRRQDDETVHDRLADQHSIKRIFVEQRKPRQMQRFMAPGRRTTPTHRAAKV